MMRRLGHMIVTALAVLCTTGATAQEIGFTAAVDRTTIAAGEYVRLTISLTNSQERFGAPDLGGLVVVQGPSENSAFNYINGRMSSSVQRSWVLTGTAPGTYTIGPARVKVGGGVIQTEPITIVVTKGSDPRPADRNASQGQSRDPNLFATISLNKSRAYVGEQVVATYLLYSRYANLELSKYELPKMTGFWAEEVDLGNTSWEEKLETVNGLQYRVAVLKRQVLFAQKSGKLRMEPLELTCLVNRSFFNRGSTVTVRSNAVELNAVPLPPSPPPGFNGAVGELDMSVHTDRTTVTANEAIQFNVKFSGKGNLKLLEAPRLDFPSDFEAYDPKVTDKISVNAGGMSGSREFEYLVIPRREGDFDLEPVTVSYFDVKSGAYRTLASDPMRITVEQGEGGASPLVQRPNKTDVTMLENDIRYIRTGDLELRPRDGFLFGSAPWIAGMATPGVLFLLFLAWRTKRDRELADVAGTRRKRADKIARRHLDHASKLLESGDRATFHAALSKALNGYMTDKFGLGLAQLTRPMVTGKLADLERGRELAEQYERLITTCDMARFAPVDTAPRRALYEEAATLIGDIERSVRK